MRTYLILFISIVIFICACTKSGAPPAPPVFEDATVAISGPSDSSYFPESAAINISASVSGTLNDYSFLKAYIIDVVSRDTVVRTSVSTNGSILAALPNTLEPGLRTFIVLVVNPARSGQFAASEELSIFIGTPPPVEITLLEKDDVSITVHWSRSDISNFGAYEVYTLRSDQPPGSSQYPDGKLLARITDQDVVSFKHDSVVFYYGYSYMAKLITQEEHTSNSARKETLAGTFVQLSQQPAYGVTSFFDRQRQKIYVALGKLMILDPQSMLIEDSIALPFSNYWINMNSSGTSLDIIFNTDFKQYRAASIDLNTRQLTLLQQFTLPSATIMGVADGTAIYWNSIRTTQPFIVITVAYDVANDRSDTIRYHSTIDDFEMISNNRILCRSITDSFFIYQKISGVFSLIKEGKIIGGDEVHESTPYITVGSAMYDQSFNKIFEIDPGGFEDYNYFTGISDDGSYVVTRQNQIINTSTRQVERVYGDGFGSDAYFSSNNDVLYQFTGISVNPTYWNPPLRFYRFPWR